MGEDIEKIARKMKELENCGLLRVVYVEDIGAKALVLSHNDKLVIGIDPNLSYESQIQELWHESLHIYSHINKLEYSKDKAESEAKQFSLKAAEHPEVILKLQTEF